jgi:HK97 gp10 family phage protein
MQMIEMHMQDMLKELQKLPEKVQKRVVNGAVRESAKPIIQEARNLAPVRTGNLIESIGVTKRRQKGTIVEYNVSPKIANDKEIAKLKKKYGLKDKSGNEIYKKLKEEKKLGGFYGQFVEFGHPIVRKGKVVGHAAPHPFMRPAFENKAEESIEAFRKYMRQRLDKELSK